MSFTPRLISRATFASTSRHLIRSSPSTIQCIAGPSRIRTRIPQPRSYRYATTLSPSSSGSSPGIPPISPKSEPSIQVIPPSLEEIKEEGFFEDDVALIPQDEARLVITPQAVQQLALITSREPPDVLSKGKLALRVGVESGGCHGYQYTMALTEERGVDDYVMTPEGVTSIPVVIDLMSLGLMKGATLHHATELIGSSFRIQNNPQAKDGGACGCGVSWEAK